MGEQEHCRPQGLRDRRGDVIRAVAPSGKPRAAAVQRHSNHVPQYAYLYYHLSACLRQPLRSVRGHEVFHYGLLCYALAVGYAEQRALGALAVYVYEAVLFEVIPPAYGLHALKQLLKTPGLKACHLHEHSFRRTQPQAGLCHSLIIPEEQHPRVLHLFHLYAEAPELKGYYALQAYFAGRYESHSLLSPLFSLPMALLKRTILIPYLLQSSSFVTSTPHLRHASYSRAAASAIFCPLEIGG